LLFDSIQAFISSLLFELLSELGLVETVLSPVSDGVFVLSHKSLLLASVLTTGACKVGSRSSREKFVDAAHQAKGSAMSSFCVLGRGSTGPQNSASSKENDGIVSEIASCVDGIVPPKAPLTIT